MNQEFPDFSVIDALAVEAGGYFAIPCEKDIRYTELLFDVSKQFGIHYYSAAPKERNFVDEVTRVTWARQQEAICSACRELGAEQPTYELRGNSLRVRFAALQSALVDESKAPKP